MLKDEAHAPIARGGVGDVGTSDRHGPLIGLLQAGDDAQQRRLAAAAGSEQRRQGAVADADVDVFERGEGAKPLGDLLDLDRHQTIAFAARVRRVNRFIASSVPSASSASTSDAT